MATACPDILQASRAVPAGTESGECATSHDHETEGVAERSGAQSRRPRVGDMRREDEDAAKEGKIEGTMSRQQMEEREGEKKEAEETKRIEEEKQKQVKDGETDRE
ncbi:UNVERIFIED_CONTAM: hypothetical protein HHA_462640 [Hammondia hammondi]|eukprot:XP_008888040.1 hypothetical protein HHA_462640 [Hammondia hammondi]